MQKQVKIEEAITRKYPEQVVLVTTCGKDGKTNVMAVGWITVASSDPLMFILGIDEEAHTYKLIKETGHFVVAFPHEGMSTETLHAGKCHGNGRDKISEAGLKTQEAKLVKSPLLADAVANFECELVDMIKPGDCAVVIGKVIAAHSNTNSSLKRLYTVNKEREHVFTLSGIRPV
jgi:flavin reductase (DIM6/NTAB) family NADH-FMN oxidoreductase RutF